jgi:putative intracellular protease/amidase
MKHRHVLWGVLALALLGLGGFGVWLFTLPPAPTGVVAPPVPAAESRAVLEALRPPKRARPLIAVIGINDATETTDYLMTYGVLKRADVADVVAVATGPGPVKLYPALTVEPDATTAAFDARHPEGADYVIVPQMSRADDPAVLGWIRAQAAKGATVIGVCAGARLVANAGLLDGKRATTHWYFLKRMLKRHPEIRYVPDRRMVADGRIMTTTGITASMPAMLTLIETIAGRAKAEAVAADLGLTAWDARHASSAFRFNRPFATTVLGNVLAVWNREQLGLALRPGMDEVSLALVADAWSRTYRSRAVTFAAGPGGVATRGGLRIVPDEVAASRPGAGLLTPLAERPPAQALDGVLAEIGRRYGEPTARVVAMQLEYPRP